MARVPLSVVFVTLNDRENLRRSLPSVNEWAGDVFVVDGGSEDGTRELAEKGGAQVVENSSANRSRQWEWALENLTFSFEWILALEGNQRVTPELAEKIHRTLSGNIKVDGYYLPVGQVFLGKRIRWGGAHHQYQLKLFRRSEVRVTPGNLLENYFAISGKSSYLKEEIIEEERDGNLDLWSEKHLDYATLKATERLLYGESHTGEASLWGNMDQRRQWREKWWLKLPTLFRSWMYFCWRYFFRLGFLDGRPGMIYHFLHGFWYPFLVDAKIWEIKERAQKERKDYRRVISEIYRDHL